MFNPEKYITNNPEMFKSIQERVDNSDTNTKPLFYLMTDNPTMSNLILGFPYIPSQLAFSYGANYNRISRSMSKTEDLQFTGNKAEDLTISNVMLDTRSQKRTFLPLIETLQGLMNNQYEPSFFYIAIQDRILYPYVLTDMSVVETGWMEGLPVKGNISFTFIRSPWGLATKLSSQDGFYNENSNKRTSKDRTDVVSQTKTDRERHEQYFK